MKLQKKNPSSNGLQRNKIQNLIKWVFIQNLGICHPAGCDNQLDSGAKLDQCGVCNGNNDTCMDIVGFFRPEDIAKAREYSKTPYYYHVTKIPKGASNIEILQPGYLDDLNYIGN